MLTSDLLEYACTVWRPSYEVHIHRIESIQRKFTRFAIRYINWDNERNQIPSYSARCQLIGLETLERRRVNADLFFVYDLLNGFLDAPTLEIKLI